MLVELIISASEAQATHARKGHLWYRHGILLKLKHCVLSRGELSSFVLLLGMEFVC